MLHIPNSVVKPWFAIIMFAFFVVSCKKEKIDINSFMQCHNVQHLDSTGIFNKITGSWHWVKQYCSGSKNATGADKTVTVTFNANATFNVLENSLIIAQGTWRLKMADINLWGLDITTQSNYLYGRILFCDNQVLFNNSYIDGCDNLFNRQ